MNALRIIYMGTPEFAVLPLEILIKNNFNVVAVITAPDKPKGRGQKIGISPVKDFAVAQGLPILQPTNLKDPAFLESLASYNADLQVVVAFRMLPEVVWDMPRLGTFNLHASLLPSYRGAAPINWAIINGEKETGVTTFFLNHDIDTGDIIFQEKEPIYEDDTAGTLYERLMHKGADLVLKTVQMISEGKHNTQKQTQGEVKNAPKIFKDDCKIDWDTASTAIVNFVRGLSPYPTAWTILDGKTLKIYKASVVEDEIQNLNSGEYITDNKGYLYFKSKDAMISVEDLQLEGKRRMDVASFLRGTKLENNKI